MTDEPTAPDEVTEPDLDEQDPPEVVPIPVLDEEPAEKPRHYVIRDTLVSQSRDGEFRIELNIPFRLVHVIEGGTPREQLYRLLRLRGRSFRHRWAGVRLARRLDALDMIDSADIVRRFWQAYGDREVLRLGESLRSGDSSRSTKQD